MGGGGFWPYPSLQLEFQRAKVEQMGDVRVYEGSEVGVDGAAGGAESCHKHLVDVTLVTIEEVLLNVW